MAELLLLLLIFFSFSKLFNDTSHDTLYPQKLSLTSPTSGSHLVGIVHLQTKSHGVFYRGNYSSRYAHLLTMGKLMVTGDKYENL
jgi:hypothetical protein